MNEILSYEFVLFFVNTYGLLALALVIALEILVWASIATALVVLRRKKIR